MFECSFEFSKDYKDLTVLWAIIIWIVCGVIFGISIIPSSPKPEEFVMSVSETNQPNCILSSYIMFAKERLDVELKIGQLQKNYPILAKDYVTFGSIKPVWDDMFPSNKLMTVFDCTKEDYLTNKVKFGKPYLWVGMWDITPSNAVNHACLVYFHPNSVSFKHFVYNPKTGYNYYVNTNYDFFNKRTAFLFQIK